MKRPSSLLIASALALFAGVPMLDAQNPPAARATASTSVTSNHTANPTTNANVSRDVEVNANVNQYGGAYYGGGCCYYPVATAPAVSTAAVVTVPVAGAVVQSIPANCVVTIVGGMTYQQCGSTWYRPQFVGTTASYVVVAPPR